MDFLGPIISIWQKVPSSWRRALTNARVAPMVRNIFNRFYADNPAVFSVAEPLRGHRMRLHWQTQKGYVFGTFEPDVTAAIQCAVQPGQVAVDLGANIGYYTLLLAKLVGPHGKVFAFEPVPIIFKVLKENVLMNGYQSVVLENKAVTNCSGRVRISTMDTDPLTATASIVSGRGVEVQAVSLDDYFRGAGERVSFVKMDVEHAENQVIEGMEALLRRDRPTMVIELHAFDTLGDRHPALLRVKAAGYSIVFLGALGPQVHILARPNV